MERQTSKFNIIKLLRQSYRFRHSRLSGILLRSPERCRIHPPQADKSRHDRYEVLENQKGIALSIVLILSTIALAIMAGLIYMLTTGTQISGVQKRYKTALEAGIGGANVSYEFIGTRGAVNPLYTFTGVSEACRTLKLNQPTASWDLGATCPANANSLSINPTATPNLDTSYDWFFQLGTAPNPVYIVYSKIVDTVEGNSGGDEGLVKGGVVASGAGEVTVVSMPYLYTMEVDAQNAANPAERAKLSVLYQY